MILQVRRFPCHDFFFGGFHSLPQRARFYCIWFVAFFMFARNASLRIKLVTDKRNENPQKQQNFSPGQNEWLEDDKKSIPFELWVLFFKGDEIWWYLVTFSGTVNCWVFLIFAQLVWNGDVCQWSWLVQLGRHKVEKRRERIEVYLNIPFVW